MKKNIIAMIAAALLATPAVAGKGKPGLEQFVVVLHMPGQAHGAKVWVQHSSDLVNWKTLKVVKASPDGVVTTVDHTTKKSPYRFYRALVLGNKDEGKDKCER